MLKANNLVGFGRRRGGPAHPGFVLTRWGTYPDSGSDSEYEFNLADVGPAFEDRNVIVCISVNDTDFGGNPANNLSNCSINGDYITKLASTYAESDNHFGATISAIYMGLVPEGETVDVSFGRFAKTMDGACMTLYTVTGLNSTTPVDSTPNNGSRVRSNNLTVSEGGFVLLVNTSNDPVTLSNVTEEFYNNYTGNRRHTGGSEFGLPAGSRTVSVSTENVQSQTMAAISMR